MDISDNYISVAAAKEVSTICKPLEQLDIKYFHYSKVYPDGSIAMLVNDANWHKHVFRQEKPGPWPVKTGQLFEKYFLWDMMYHQELMTDAKECFGINNGVLIFNKKAKYFEVCSFGLNKNCKKTLSFLLSNVDLLEKFREYFKERAANFIAKAEKNRIVLSKSMYENPKFQDFTQESFQDSRMKFLTAISNVKKEKELIELKKKLTKRELECLHELSQGKTAKAIGRSLGLSHRTVEYYLSNVKSKADCYNRSQLVELYLKIEKL